MNNSAKSLHSQRISPYLLRRCRSLEEAQAEKVSKPSCAPMEPDDDLERVDNRAFRE